MRLSKAYRVLLFQLAVSLMLVNGQRRDLEAKYSFHLTLNERPRYMLYWSVDLAKKEVSFAVDVNALGWVGLGLSKNGQMIGSDVVTAWITDDGMPQLQDRFASELSLPSVDSKQDWELLGGRIEGGHTIIETKRPFITCDVKKDIDITTSTIYVVWSFNENAKPASPEDLQKHTHSGSTAINILGKAEQREEPDNAGSFTLRTENTTIPASKTSYWCQVVQIPPEERYIYKFAPSITESSRQRKFVHHMLIYECPLITSNNIAQLNSMSGECASSGFPVAGCRGAKVLAGWAIGGQDFYYPRDVAYRTGLSFSDEYAVLEIHYDNPNELKGFVDSSGIQFSYTRQAPKHLAGVITLGHHVASNMVIPPGQEQYSIGGVCSGMCTNQFLQDQPITLFGALLHTHLAGKTVELRHFRETEECGGTQELEPIEQNLNYDVDYQQVNLFPKQTEVEPGDSLVVYCRYNTVGREIVTLGGEGTLDEMCLTFLFYYPRRDLTFCTSLPVPSTAYAPLQNILMGEDYGLLQEKFLNFGVTQSQNITSLLEPVQWTRELSCDLQESTMTNNVIQICLDDFRSFDPASLSQVGLPDVKCPYKSPSLSECDQVLEDPAATANYLCQMSGEMNMGGSSTYMKVVLGFVAGIISTHYYTT